jgi:hypothetical protein
MAIEGLAFTLTFNQYGEFISVTAADGTPSSPHNMMRDISHGREVARRSLGEWTRLDVGNGRCAYGYHLPNCDIVVWRRDDWAGDLRFTLSFDQYGNLLAVQFPDDPLPHAHNMMKDAPVGYPVAAKSLGELIRLEIQAGVYAYGYHLPNCDIVIL